MKSLLPAVIFAAPCLALAEEALLTTELDPPYYLGREQAEEAPTDLETITVYGKRPLWGLDPRWRELLPCLGCDGKTRVPLALEFGKAVGIFALKPFFQQPRCRGEPNDEAAYYALRSAQNLDDSVGGIDRHPATGLFNWVYDEKQCR